MHRDILPVSIIGHCPPLPDKCSFMEMILDIRAKVNREKEDCKFRQDTTISYFNSLRVNNIWIPCRHYFVDWLFARFLKANPKISCLSVVVGELGEIVLHARAEGFIADVSIEHPENRASLEIKKVHESITDRKITIYWCHSWFVWFWTCIDQF